MRNKIPKYYNSKQNIMLLLGGTAAFAELFILVFAPFKSRTWVDSDWQFLGWTSLVVLVGIAVAAVSRIGMYWYAKKHDISYLTYGCWILAELAVMALCYTLYPLLSQPEFSQQFDLSFLSLFKETWIATGFILLIPYTIMILIFELRDKNEQLSLLEKQRTSELPVDQPDMYNFYDEKGELKLCVKPEKVYYLESADNYVQIHYVNAGKMQNLMIRNTLKNIEWRFQGKELVRCHRSYIVNFSKVQMMRKVDGEVVLDFGDEHVPPIPVSKGYCEDVMDRFNRLTKN